MEVLVLVVHVCRDGDVPVHHGVEAGDPDAAADAFGKGLRAVDHLLLRHHRSALVHVADALVQVSLPDRRRSGADRVNQLLRLPLQDIRHIFGGDRGRSDREEESEPEGESGRSAST